MIDKELWKKYAGKDFNVEDFIGAKGEVAPVGPRGHHDDPGPESPEERERRIALSSIDGNRLILKLAEQILSRDGFIKVLHVIEDEEGSIIDWGLLGDPGESGQPDSNLSNEELIKHAGFKIPGDTD